MKYYLIIGLFFFSVTVRAQSKKEVKKNGISSIKVTSSKEVNGSMTEQNESFTRYDKDGNETEEINYTETGEFKSKIKRVFNKYNDQVEESHYDKDDRLIKQIKTKYNVNNDKQEETVYDGNGKLQEKTLYTYNANNDKSAEVVMDANGVLKKKEIFVYDRKGMRIQKSSYDGAGRLLGIKKYEYEY